MTESQQETAPTENAAASYTANRYVIIEDVDISFWNMVLLMVKFAFAVIPAAFIVGGIVLVITMVFGGLFGL